LILEMPSGVIDFSYSTISLLIPSNDYFDESDSSYRLYSMRWIALTGYILYENLFVSDSNSDSEVGINISPNSNYFVDNSGN
jgi:hypothetical protein